MPNANTEDAPSDPPVGDGGGLGRYAVQQLDQLEPVPCPCGTARRGFREVAGAPASVHVVEIARDSRVHHHKAMTETYVVLEGEGEIELDGQVFPLKPLTAVMIRPGCRHRAYPTGERPLRILNIAIPVFDPEDEWED